MENASQSSESAEETGWLSPNLDKQALFPASLAAKNGHRTELWPLNVGANDVLCSQAWPTNLPHSFLFPEWQCPLPSFVPAPPPFRSTAFRLYWRDKLLFC